MRALLCILAIASGVFVVQPQPAIAASNVWLPLWGQAYSPNLGWFNFFCENGSTRPEDIVLGEEVVPTDCSLTKADGNVGYKVEYNPSTNELRGSAYNTNYGWLDLSNVTVVQTDTTNDIWELRDPSTVSAQGNLGKVYFQADNPNSNNDGVAYNRRTSILLGVAYSAQSGWIYFNSDGSDTSRPIPHEIFLDTQEPVLISAPSALRPGVPHTLTVTFADNSAALIDESLSSVWGQAYSNNAGYINFYCDGGNARPSGKIVGASSVPGCDNESTNYRVEYNAQTGALTGHAYSTNYGWLRIGTGSGSSHEGAAITTSGENINQVTGSTTFGNFSETDFAEGSDASVQPGLTFSDVTDKICGQAWSSQAGVISFCSDASDQNGYAVFLDKQGVSPVSLIQTSLITPSGSSVAAQSTTESESVIFEHTFTEVGDYSLSYKACDAFDNCIEAVIEDFYSVTAPGTITTGSALDLFYLGVNGNFTPLSQTQASAVCASNTGNGFVEVIADYGTANVAVVSGATASIADSVDEKRLTTRVWIESVNPVTGAVECWPAEESSTMQLQIDYQINDTSRLNHYSASSGSALIYQNGADASGNRRVAGNSTAEGDDRLASLRLSSLTPTASGSSVVDPAIDVTLTGFTIDITCLSSVCSSQTINKSGLDIGVPFSPQVGVSTDALSDLYIGQEFEFDLTLSNRSSSQTLNNARVTGIFDVFENDVLLDTVRWGTATNGSGSSVPLDPVGGVPQFTASNLNASLSPGASVQTTGLAATPRLEVTDDEDSGTVSSNLTAQFNIAVQVGALSYPVAGVDISGRNAAGVDIIGVATSSNASSRSRGSTGQLGISFLDASYLKTTMRRAVTPIIRRVAEDPDVTPCTGSTTAEVFSVNCKPIADKNIYLTASDVTIGALATDQAKTLIIIGGDVTITGNIDSSAGLLGLIVLQADINQDGTKTGGTIRIYPQVTAIESVIFAEGAIISVDSTGSSQIADRRTALANQLFIHGAVSSWNTIGGANLTPLVCPRQLGLSTCDFEDALRYDISYWRSYLPDGLGVAAPGITNVAPVIVQYDTRIQHTAPPLFTGVDAIFSRSVSR